MRMTRVPIATMAPAARSSAIAGKLVITRSAGCFAGNVETSRVRITDGEVAR